MKTKKVSGWELIDKYINAWYCRTLPMIDLDNGGKRIPPPSEKEWVAGVRKDLNKLLAKELRGLKDEVDKVLGNIRRFDDKEKGADYFAGWDNCLDTIIMDFKAINQRLKEKGNYKDFPVKSKYSEKAPEPEWEKG